MFSIHRRVCANLCKPPQKWIDIVYRVLIEDYFITEFSGYYFNDHVVQKM